MDGNTTAFLEERVKKGLGELNGIVHRLRTEFLAFETLRQDVYAFQLALEALTRDLPNPYKRRGLPQVSMSVQGLEPEIDKPLPPEAVKDRRATSDALDLFGVPTQSAQRRRPGKALDFSDSSPTGVVRRILHDAGKALTVEEILQRIPSNIPITMDRDSIYRTVPKMVKRREILHVSRGTYQYNQEFLEQEA